jgi:FdhD protein
VVRPAAARLTVIGAALRAMQQQQPLRLMTGSTHAAALCRLTDGGIELLREDVGRHNALDKLIGAMKGRGRDPTAHFIAISSRASFEMVQKTILAGVPVLAAASAPTAMAADLAAASGLLLLGFVRDDEMVAYNFLDRLQHDVQHNK